MKFAELEIFKRHAKATNDKDALWLIEQAEKARQYKRALEEISDILEGEHVTPLVERLAYALSSSGIYNKKQ